MKTFTLYRATSSFLENINQNKDHLNLHRDRIFVGNDLVSSVNAIITMLKSGFLVPAATCVAKNEDDMFRLTNSITCNWTDNDEVNVLDDSAFLSSTSVGDIFKDEDGQFFIVSNFSMEKISLPEELIS